MSLSTPTTQQISDNIIAQLEASLSQSIPLLPKSFLRVLAKTLAAVFMLLYKYAGFMFLQIFVRTASFSNTEVNGIVFNPLLEWGRLIGVGDPGEGRQAELLIEVTVENQTGSLPANTQLVGPNNGVTYITLTSVLLNAPTKQVTVRAVADQNDTGGEGEIGNLDPSEILQFANPLANVNRAAVVISQTVTGVEPEGEDDYRQRVIDRFQKRPQGGAYSDYEIWGEEVTGIINVYPYTSACPGQVDVYVEADAVDGIPTTAQLQAVLDSIELDLAGVASRRPANALVNVYPITRTAFTVEVTGLQVSDLAQTQSDITTAIQEYFLDRAPYIAGLTVPPRKDRITSTGINGVVEDIVSAVGGVYTGAIVRQSGVMISLYSLDVGEKAKATVSFS